MNNPMRLRLPCWMAASLNMVISKALSYGALVPERSSGARSSKVMQLEGFGYTIV